ncbi:MAG: hypothetical protein EBY38_08685 [Flavobacteriaceae bacterium]|nr:hypothetical protein [Flavobacteriaceae bacterium]
MSVIIKFPPHLKPTLKHLAGQHDQKTHGRWAESGLPHELSDYEATFRDLREANLLQKATLDKWGAPRVSRKKVVDTKYITSTRLEDMPKDYIEASPGSGVYRKYGDELAQNTLDTPFMRLDVDAMKKEIQENGNLDAELEKKISEISQKYVAGYKDDIEEHYQKVARDMGLGGRNASYFVQAMTERVGIFVTNTNNSVRHELAEAMVPYLPKGDRAIFMKEYFKQYAKTAETVKENLSKAFPVIAIDGEDFMKVIADGRFKTQYETRESNGAYKPALRRTRELAYMGVPQDTKASERPIYGFLATQIDGTTPNTSGYNIDRWNIGNRGVGQYGEIRVVLNDAARERTSYTVVDSLDGYALARPLTEKHTRGTMEMAGLLQDLTTSHGGLQRDSYTESQTYGGIKLKDIKSIYVMPPSTASWLTNTVNETTMNNIKQALKEKGLDIPVVALVPKVTEEG